MKTGDGTRRIALVSGAIGAHPAGKRHEGQSRVGAGAILSRWTDHSICILWAMVLALAFPPPACCSLVRHAPRAGLCVAMAGVPTASPPISQVGHRPQPACQDMAPASACSPLRHVGGPRCSCGAAPRAPRSAGRDPPPAPEGAADRRGGGTLERGDAVEGACRRVGRHHGRALVPRPPLRRPPPNPCPRRTEAVGRSFVYPLDTLRTRMQIDPTKHVSLLNQARPAPSTPAAAAAAVAGTAAAAAAAAAAPPLSGAGRGGRWW